MLSLKIKFARCSLLPLWRSAVLLVVIFEVVHCQEQCSGGESCVVPQPLGGHTGKDLDTLWLEMRCYLGCVDQYYDGGQSNGIDWNTQWPTLNFSSFESNCGIYQKVRGCTEGCLQRHRDRSTSINRCRDNCYSTCLEERSCAEPGTCAVPPKPSTCSRSCRKTYCRFGCEVYDLIHAPTTSSFQRHPSQSSEPPAIHPASTPQPARDWHYSVDARDSLMSSHVGSLAPQENMIYSTVGYLIKVSTDDEDYYFWQKHSTELLDFTAFSCKMTSISFSVVSKYSLQENQQLTFSPTSSLCIPGVGGYPSQLKTSSIRVSYTEDTREDFLGYSVARLSWDKPDNSQFVTSYSIRVYPNEMRCGGNTDVVYTFNDIDKDLTEFTLRAKTDNGLWRFGCSYLIEVVARPTMTSLSETIGAYVSSATEVTEEFPSFELNCSRVWDQQGKFSISMSWLFPDDTQLSHISRFVIIPQLTLKGTGTPVQLYENSQVYLTNDDQIKFDATTQKFTPVLDSNRMRYTVEVKSEKNNLYTWRRIPRTQSCSVPATPLPPRNISSVSVTDLDFDRENRTLQLSVDVIPSEKIHGTVEEYEVVLRRSLSDCYECEEAFRFLSGSSPVEIHSTIQLNDSDHCLYLNVRLFNNYNLSSHWSPVQVLALDEECVTTDLDLESQGPRVSVYYETGDGAGEREQVLEFGCESFAPSSSSNSFAGRLQQIMDRLDNINSRFLSAPNAEERATQLDQKLQSMEEKLDNVLEILAQQTHQGT